MKTISFQIDQTLLDKIDKLVRPSQCRSEIMRQILNDYIEGYQPIDVLLKQVLNKLDALEVKGNG